MDQMNWINESKFNGKLITLGIGMHSNYYFLNELSMINKGFTHTICNINDNNTLNHLLKMANKPILTNIRIGLKVDTINFNPDPLNDLYIHSPMIVSIVYKSNKLQRKIVIQG